MIYLTEQAIYFTPLCSVPANSWSALLLLSWQAGSPRLRAFFFCLPLKHHAHPWQCINSKWNSSWLKEELKRAFSIFCLISILRYLRCGGGKGKACRFLCIKYLIFDWMGTCSEQRGFHWKVCDMMKSSWGASVSPAFKWVLLPFYHLQGSELLKICLAYLQNRNSIVSILLNKKSHNYSLLFARLLCFGMCCISLLAREDTLIRKMPGSVFVRWSGIFSFPCDIDSVQIFVKLMC